ncbi:MAG: hypothetical protein C4293_05665 [Nitrospiraceae bacterium]
MKTSKSFDPESAGPQEISSKPPVQRQTILLVDDEAMIREFICATLLMYGYAVLEASRGTEALHICQHHWGPIHLLLTDVCMPEMNGRILAEHVTALRPFTRVLFMSAEVVVPFERAFIQKPFTPEVLAQKIHEILHPDQS